MTSPQRRPKGSRWGSLLSGAVAGLESRLDTILADDNEASARSRATEKVLLEAKIARAKEDAGSLAPPRVSSELSRSSSRSRVNDKLAERLAKATGSKAGSQVASEVTSPAAESPRTSLDSRPSMDIQRVSTPMLQITAEEDGTAQVEKMLLTEEAEQPDEGFTDSLQASILPINPAQQPKRELPASSLVADNELAPAIDHTETNGITAVSRSNEELEAEMQQMRADHETAEKQRQEEMHANLERIDALQAKLQYLARESVAAAQQANANASAGSLEEKLAEKDERISPVSYTHLTLPTKRIV